MIFARPAFFAAVLCFVHILRIEGGFENELARNRKRLVDEFPMNDVEWFAAGTIGR